MGRRAVQEWRLLFVSSVKSYTMDLVCWDQKGEKPNIYF